MRGVKKKRRLQKLEKKDKTKNGNEVPPLQRRARQAVPLWEKARTGLKPGHYIKRVTGGR